MQLSKSTMEELKSLVAEEFRPGEIRRVPGHGEMYIAPDGTDLPQEYSKLLTVDIEGQKYLILSRKTEEVR